MTAVTQKTSQLDILEKLFKTQSDVSEVQKNAFASIPQHGVPNLRTERWKYTPLRKAIHTELKISSDSLNGLKKHELIENLLASDTPVEIVQIVNGQLYGEFSNSKALIKISDEILESTASQSDNFISNLNLAFLKSNLQLQVTGEVHPLLVLHLHNSNENDLNAYQIGIDADDNCKAEILVLQTSDTGVNTQIPVITVDAGKHSEIKLYYCQEHGQNTSQLAQSNIQLARDANVSMVQLELGGGLIRHNIIAEALDKGAEFNLSSLFIQSDRQHIDTHLDMYHYAAHTQSTMLSKAILDERSRCVFNGKIYVEKDAQQINANLNNDTLLLSKYAEINTKPELEIYADDVKCAHGATVGQLDEQAIFYLRSRGLNQAEAEKMLTSAFARRVYTGSVPEALEKYLDSKLGFSGN